MRATAFLNATIIGGVGLTGLALFALPVIEDMNDGTISLPVGNAAAAAAMVYVLLAPVLLSLTHRLATRLIAIGVAVGMAAVARAWVGLIEAEDVGLAVVVTAGAVALTGAVGLLVQALARRRRARVSMLAWLLARATTRITETLRRRYAGSPDNGRFDGPLPQTLLVENLVLSVLSQAEAEDTPEDFAAVVATGLAELRDGLGGGTRPQARSHAATIAAEYCARLGAELRRLAPTAATPDSGDLRRLA